MSARAQYLTPPEVARLLRVKPEKVRAWIDRGELQAIDVSDTVGRPLYRVSATDLDAFIRRRQIQRE